MVCSFGDLSPGAQIELKFSGQFRQDKRFRTHVFVESTTPDSDPTNNNDRQRFKVHENERPKPVGNALACGSGPVRLVGGDQSGTAGDSGGDDIEVFSDLEVRLNGETIFEDDNGFPQVPPFGALDPIEFQAEDGDRLQVIARVGFLAPAEFLDPLTLVCDDGREQELTDGVPFGPPSGGPGSTFFDDEFTIDLGS